jgi:ATP-binding cassette subfamily F protein uup
VRALKHLRELRRERREQPGNVRLQIQQARRSGRLVIEAEGVGYGYGSQVILHDFSTTILRGDKVGIIGPNGSGKTTLLRILMGELAPQQGQVRLGVNLEVAYFDQLRAQLDESQSVLDNVGQGRDTVTIDGWARSLMGYLEDFLFTRERAQSPIHTLSGGERNRLLLARLFTRPANLLVLDEPTNDLDIETLELLENMLLAYKGTLLLVSHDRAFLNNLVTNTLALEGDGQVGEYVGGYDDWLRQSRANVPKQGSSKREAAKQEPAIARKAAPPALPGAPRKLNFKEQRALEAQQRELAGLPQRIETLEAEQEQLTAAMASPAFYQQDSAEIARSSNRLKALQEELVLAYTRWEELERMLG